MPPRLNHRKSRLGCTCCKTRKIKCDEKKPQCSACERHGIKCTYSDFIPPRRRRNVAHDAEKEALSSSSTVDDKVVTVGPEDPYEANILDIAEGKRKQLELFLQHRFASVVASTFPSAENPDLQYMYSRDAVELSFSNAFLQNTIFAITALYTALQLVRNHPTGDVPSSDLPPVVADIDFAQVHRFYLNLAIQQQRTALSTITTENSSALGLTSIMLSIMAAKLLPESDQESLASKRYSIPVQSLYISEATGPILVLARPYLLPDSPVHKLVHSAGINYSLEFDSYDVKSLFNPETAKPFQPLLDFEDPLDAEDNNPNLTKTYTRAVVFVGGINSAIARNEVTHMICRRIMSFAPVLPKHFVHLLAEQRPRAMVIFAYYMAMVKSVERYWWLQGAAEREVHGIRSILPERWKWAMEWPLETLARLEAENSALDACVPTQPVSARSI